MALIYDFTVTDIDGQARAMREWQGKVIVIVNVASKCGFTPQYEGLERLYRAHRDSGLVVLGFPCDQFGNQEPGDAEEIKQFCSLTYDVTFPMFAKIKVNGPDAEPLYEWLKSEKPGALGIGMIKWNFTKFLIDRNGQVVRRFAPTDAPAKMEKDIEALLG